MLGNAHCLTGMLMVTGALLAMAVARPARAQSGEGSVIPDDRRIEWKPGVPGGIPKYPVFASVKDAPYSARGDGAADDTAAIQKALDDCPAGKAVLLPAGTYRLTAQLSITKGIVLRGEGPEKTALVSEATTKHIIGACNFDNSISTRILNGYTKGSTALTVEDASRFKAGDLLSVDQLNDPDIVDIQGAGGACGWAGREKGQRAMAQLVLLKALNGNTMTLSRPLYYDFKEALKPEVIRTTDKTITGAGVEDLRTEMARHHDKGDRGSSIKFWNGIHCWVRNVECLKGWYAGHVTLQHCLGCEVRDSYFHHPHAFGGGHGYGVWIFGHSTDTLVENNVCYNLNSGIMLECGGPGNVVAYNFSRRMFGRDYPKTDWAHHDLSLHGAHPYMNLFEGNDVSTVSLDCYWGSGSHTTLFRNNADMNCRMVNGNPMMAVMGVCAAAMHRYVIVAGNVFGREGMQGVVEAPGLPPPGQPQVWRLGYKAPSGNGTPDDPKVAQTILRHGNFDYVTKQTQWDSSISNHKLPASLYLSAKPAYFGNLPWPPIGPDLNPMVSTIPARERFLKVPAPEREAQDLFYLGEFHAAAGQKEEAKAAYQQAVEKYPSSASAPLARVQLEKLK